MTKENAIDPWDFSDVSDLDADLANSLSRKTSSGKQDNIVKYADLVSGAGKPVNIAQIRAAASRVFGTTHGTQTVRGYVQDAAEQGLLSRVNKTQYAAPIEGPVAEENEEELGLEEL